MSRRILRAAAIAAVAAAVAPGTAWAVTPVNGGAAGGTTITIDDGPGDQTDPKVSGNLATYTDVNTGRVRYYDFGTSANVAVPIPAGSISNIADVSGSQIAFVSAFLQGQSVVRTTMVYDVSSGALVEIDPPGVYDPFGVAIGGDTVAFQDALSGNGDIVVWDLASGTAQDVSASPDADGNPQVAPDGTLVVWERCETVFFRCDIYRSRRTGLAWGPAEPVLVAPLSAELNPDTDGTTIVYDSDRTGPNESDIYFRPAAGGPETQLSLPGTQRNPRIAHGVIVFESQPSGSAATDIFVYVIATNTVFRVTDSPMINDVLNDVVVLPNGDVRVVWAPETTQFNVHDIVARTFTLPATDATPPAIVPTVSGTLGANGWYTSDIGLTWNLSEPDSPGSLVKTGCVDRSITADQAATAYSCSATSDGGSAGPVEVTIKRDATPPTLAFSGNAGTYTVAQTVAIGCAASDNLSGVATNCSGVSAPASSFPLGSTTITRGATDNAGNTGNGSTSFTVVVDSRSLCTLTGQYVQGSAHYQALGPAARRLVDAAVNAACVYLTSIGPQTHPAQKAAFINAYKAAAQALARAGWLTPAEAATLGGLADRL
jgi:hypothetical protein